MTTSRYLSTRELSALNRLGDILCPGDAQLPRFSATGAVSRFDDMAHYMVVSDRDDLKTLLSVFSFLPDVVIRMMLAVFAVMERLPGPPGALGRLVMFGLKGVVTTLYFGFADNDGKSGDTVRQVLGWDAAIRSAVSHGDDLVKAEDVNPMNQAVQDVPVDAAAVFSRVRQARPSLAALGVRERLVYVHRLNELVRDEREAIVTRIQQETGKSRTDALISEIFPLLEHFEFLIKYAEKALADETVPTPLAMMGKKSRVYYEPLGTILVISPWNYPFYQALTPITAALVTGNTVVYKPSELTPLEGLVESFLERAGIPDDWVQIVYGAGDVGSRLIDQRPDKIFFTGSVATGKKIMAQASQQLIPVELELGGKDPMLVFDDVNIERAVQGALWGALTNVGQSCTSVERLYVQRGIYKDFRDRLVASARQITLGVDNDGSADMGRMTSPRQVTIVSDLVNDARANGATLLCGGEWDGKSEFIPPIIIEGSTHAMRINQEELFGPVVTIFPFDTEEEAVRLANDSAFGLSASVWTADMARADRVTRALVTGNVSVNNVMLSEGNHALPFGGVKDSGIGRYKGIHGLRGFCNQKSVLIDSNSKKIEANWYPYTKKKYMLFGALTQALFSHGPMALVKFAVSGMTLEGYSQKAKRGE
jgi:aldehyde dehydrogenase (NAD+)